MKRTTDTFLFISHTTDILLFKFRCNIFIGVRIIKEMPGLVASGTLYIFNKILSTGIFPDRLKYSEVKPFYKKGDKTEVSNYSPISLLTSFSKIIEKIIHERLYCHLNKNNILVNEQFGFREKLWQLSRFLIKYCHLWIGKILLKDYSVSCKRHLIVLTMIYFWSKLLAY